MTALWSRTSTAVNTGYGMNFGRLPDPYYKPRPWGIPGIHPELLMEPPYAQKTHKMETRGGSSLVKGSAAAKARMAYLRSLRGKKSGKGALRGGKSYNSAALRGGADSLGNFADILSGLKGDALNAVKELAVETGSSITDLIRHPKDLVSKIKGFFHIGGKGKKKENEAASKAAKLKVYLQYLKENDPEQYERVKASYLKQKREKMERELGIYNEPSVTMDEDTIPAPAPTPAPRSGGRRRRGTGLKRKTIPELNMSYY